MKKIAAAFVIVTMGLLSLSCTNESGSRRALEAQGFTEIQFTGHSWFTCGKEDSFSTGFRAKNPRGQQVSGTVCCGWLKSCTVRF